MHFFFLNNHLFQDSDHPRHNEVWDPPRYEAEKAIASPGKGWGFCSEECDKLNSQPSGVIYTGLGLMAYLSDEKCKELLGVNLNIHNNRLKLQDSHILFPWEFFLKESFKNSSTI